MSKIESHRDLIVWQKAMDLAVLAYELTRDFPRSEQYGITSQLTRAAASVPANVAEGRARSTARDYVHFLHIARGSLAEAETFIELAIRLGYASAEKASRLLALADEVGRMLLGLQRRLAPRA